MEAPDGATTREDSGADASPPSFVFSDDFERPDGTMVPPWSALKVNRGRLEITKPFGATSHVLVAQTEAVSGASAYPERTFSVPIGRAVATFQVKIVDFVPSDGGSNETANLFALRVRTSGGAGTDHVVRVGLRRQANTRFAVFVQSQLEDVKTRTTDSTTLLELGRTYKFRFEADLTTPRAGVEVARAFVDGTPIATLTSVGDVPTTHRPAGEVFCPGAVAGGAGFELEIDDVDIVGHP